MGEAVTNWKANWNFVVSVLWENVYVYEMPLYACSVAKSCLTLCDPMDCSPPGSPVHGISQARLMERVAISFSRGIFLTQGLNPQLLHWQADSLPLSHQGSLTLCWVPSVGIMGWRTDGSVQQRGLISTASYWLFIHEVALMEWCHREVSGTCNRQAPAFSFVSISPSIKWEWTSWYLGALLVPTSWKLISSLGDLRGVSGWNG